MSDDYTFDRKKMVEEQLKGRGIHSPQILSAFSAVPRHEFVPENLREQAYADGPLPIGHGQTISQPFMVATMLQTAELAPGDRVLEIGTGSGYQAALLAEMATEVFSIDRIAELLEQARDTLERLGYHEIHLRVADGTAGWEEEAPFDAILVAAGAPRIPQPLLDQLGMQGRLVIPIEEGLSQVLYKVVRVEEGFKKIRGERCTFVPLIGAHGWKADPRIQ